MATHDIAYQIITDRITALLEQGTVPWHQPWAGEAGLPTNLVSKKAYRGINVFLLGAQGYTSPWWVSFPKQVNDLGGSLTRGEHVSYAVFWKLLEKSQTTDDGEDTTVRIPYLRYNVFA